MSADPDDNSPPPCLEEEPEAALRVRSLEFLARFDAECRRLQGGDAAVVLGALPDEAPIVFECVSPPHEATSEAA